MICLELHFSRVLIINTYSFFYRYFFPTNVLTHMDGDNMSQSIEHEQEFFSIMEVGGCVVGVWWVCGGCVLHCMSCVCSPCRVLGTRSCSQTSLSSNSTSSQLKLSTPNTSSIQRYDSTYSNLLYFRLKYFHLINISVNIFISLILV